MNTTQQIYKIRGFTLVEVIVYVAILAIVSVVVVNGVLVSMSSFAAARNNRTLASVALDTMERMSREIRNAQSVSVIGTSFDVDPGAITLNSLDEEGDPITVALTVSGGAIMLSENGETPEPLSNGRATVTSLMFNNIETERGTAVKITMTLEDMLSGEQSATFNTTVGLRGSYSL